MFVYAAELGALFLVAWLLPLLAHDPRPIQAMFSAEEGLLAIAGGLGVGALVHVTGSAFWTFFFRYERPRGALALEYLARQVAALDRSLPAPSRSLRESVFWREAASRRFPVSRAALAPISTDPRNQAVILNAYKLLGTGTFATEALVDWIRRRIQRFTDNANAAIALLLGSAFSIWWQPSGWSLERAAVTIIIVLLALMTLGHGWSQRRQGEQMEEFLLALRGAEPEPPDPAAGQAAEPVAVPAAAPAVVVAKKGGSKGGGKRGGKGDRQKKAKP